MKAKMHYKDSFGMIFSIIFVSCKELPKKMILDQLILKTL